MSHFIGIDLGTTNSAICSYDGSETKIWKTPERNDVTPSVIHFDPRGNKHIGHRAYDVAPIYYENCAMLFKRRMGEDTSIELPAVSRTLTPEECSAEILKALFDSLPEEIRNTAETGTVVTVPAAFNQKASKATKQAADMAGIGKVELMQEPVAAVMSFMRVSKTDGTFLIYDLGGGTFDVAIAQSTGGRVNLLAHGGIEMCGGRDFDRLIVDNVIFPILQKKYNLPDDLSKDKNFEKLLRILTYSAEQGKKELSRSNQGEVVILIPNNMNWFDHVGDLDGTQIYEDIPLQHNIFDQLIAEKVNDTINCARKTMEECGVNSQDIDRIVWVGGPTHYKPLRDTVSSALGIKGDMSVDPMTAVAEGASLFAESVDWSSEDYRPKSTRGQITSDALAVSFNYTARTPSDTSKIVVQVKEQVPAGSEFQVDSLDHAWTSGRIPLQHAATVDVALTKPGDNTFGIVAYDAQGKRIPIEQDEIVITKTAAIVEAIPASSTISLGVLDRPGGQPIPEKLIEKGDALPKKGTLSLKSDKELRAGSSDSINFTLWEGEIREDILANEYIGDFKIAGTDFDEGVIPAGADLICNYEMQASGEIKLEVEVPDIRGIFESSGPNLYSPDAAKVDYGSKAGEVIEEGAKGRNRVNEIKAVVTDEKLTQAQQKLEAANVLDSDESDPEKVKEAEQGIRQANELLDEVIRKNRKQIRQSDLDKEITFFDMYCRQGARESEANAFDNLVETAQRSIDNDDNDFDNHISQLGGRIFEILWRQPWFVIEQFKQFTRSPYGYTDRLRFEQLARDGRNLLERDVIRRYETLPENEKFQAAFIDDGTIDELREIIRELISIRSASGGEVTARDVLINISRA